MLSPTGRCKTFDQDADGYVRGEGAGIVLLKPLDKAIADQDQIYGLIKSSATNHGGRVKTLTSPSPYAQSQVIQEAYKQAEIHPNEVSYIEAHGTGTPLGDPIEINGLKRAWQALARHFKMDLQTRHCGIGTVKTNIGHLEGSAGIAGLIKILLAFKHKTLPALKHFKVVNPKIKLEGSPFYLVTKNQPWKPENKGESLKAGVIPNSKINYTNLIHSLSHKLLINPASLTI